MLSKENFVRILNNNVINESVHWAFNLNKEFLSPEPEPWDGPDGYKAAKEKVVALHVVNDCAERDIKLATGTQHTTKSSVSSLFKL